MKVKVITILLFFTPGIVFTQNIIEERKGDIRIKLKGFFTSNNKIFKSRRPFRELNFDYKSKVLEIINYGKIHNADLRLIDSIVKYYYDENGVLVKSKEWKTDYQKNISQRFYTNYSYNLRNQLIKEKMFYYKNDSLFIETNYEYDEKGNHIKTTSGKAAYYKWNYDEENKLISFQQFYHETNKVRWEYNYTYQNSCRVGLFKTYYSDGNYTTRESKCSKTNNITEMVEIDDEGFKRKTLLYYNSNNIIKKIEKYISYSTDSSYQLDSFIKIKIQGSQKIARNIVEKINEEIKFLNI